MNFRSELGQVVRQEVKRLYKLELDPALEHPKNLDFGDYATGVSLMIASELEADPLEIAHRLAEAISTYQLTSIRSIDVVKPGFINFWLAREVLVGEVNRANRLREGYGRLEIGRGKTVLIDYSSPNIARPFGIGHLRSTIVGQALYNLYSFAGWRTIGENYLGDWGTQFGKLIYAVLTWSDERKIAVAKPVEELEKLYVRFHKEAARDPQLEEKAREWFKRLESGDRQAAGLWKKFRRWSIEEFERIYKLLGVKIDRTTGESFYVTWVPQVIKEARAMGLAVESEGALIIRFPKETKSRPTTRVGDPRHKVPGLPPLMLLKSDGATTYESRDLAAIKVRKKKFRPTLYLYETGVEQALRFKQLFLAAQMLVYGAVDQFVHIAHGLYRFPEGKISTRLGRTVRLEDILEEAIRRARKIAEEKNPDLSNKEKERVSKAVGIGAVKYNDLSQHYSTEVVFDWEKMLSLEGNSAPYLQYTYARARSVLRKAQQRHLPFFDVLSTMGKKNMVHGRLVHSRSSMVHGTLSEEELRILRGLYRFPELIEDAVVSNSPNLVCNFLFELAQRFNSFYARVPILKAESRESKVLRLGLTAATAQVIKNGLTLLGIETPERL